jgi:hypoxanthine phosphoribosyltransferase
MNKRIIRNRELQGLVNTICRDIANSDWRPDYVVGITRGGLVPAVMISHYFDVRMEALKVSLRDGGECESNCWMAEDAFGYVPTEERGESGTQVDPAKRKNILIVDDINDTGATINWIMRDWQSSCLPNHSAWDHVWGNNVRFAVLFDNLSSESKIAVNYSAETINKAEQDVWIDFPYESWWTK